MNLIFYAIVLFCFTKYEARRIDKLQYIDKWDKNLTMLIRGALCILAAENIIQFPAYALITIGAWDWCINGFSKIIRSNYGLWFVGTQGRWYDFWKDKPLWTYKVFRYGTVAGGLALMAISYVYGKLPPYIIL